MHEQSLVSTQNVCLVEINLFDEVNRYRNKKVNHFWKNRFIAKTLYLKSSLSHNLLLNFVFTQIIGKLIRAKVMAKENETQCLFLLQKLKTENYRLS